MDFRHFRLKRQEVQRLKRQATKLEARLRVLYPRKPIQLLFFEDGDGEDEGAYGDR